MTPVLRTPRVPLPVLVASTGLPREAEWITQGLFASIGAWRKTTSTARQLVAYAALREEAEIMGSDFHNRWTQAEEAVTAMRELWTRDKSEFHGKYYDFPPV